MKNDVSKKMICKNCGNEISGKWRRFFCSDKCNQEFYIKKKKEMYSLEQRRFYGSISYRIEKNIKLIQKINIEIKKYNEKNIKYIHNKRLSLQRKKLSIIDRIKNLIEIRKSIKPIKSYKLNEKLSTNKEK